MIKYKVIWNKKSLKDLKGVDKKEALRIVKKIESTLVDNPEAGTQLKGALKGLLKFRIGDYRVVYSKDDRLLTILVLRVGHRKEVYN